MEKSTSFFSSPGEWVDAEFGFLWNYSISISIVILEIILSFRETKSATRTVVWALKTFSWVYCLGCISVALAIDSISYDNMV